MKLHIYMLTSSMFNWILWKINHWSIITKDWRWSVLCKVKFFRNIPQSNSLRSTWCYSNILGLSNRQSNNRLLLWRPRNKFGPQNQNISPYAFPVFDVSIIVVISVTNQISSYFNPIKNLKLLVFFKYHRILLADYRCISFGLSFEPANEGYNVHNIRPCFHQIH